MSIASSACSFSQISMTCTHFYQHTLLILFNRHLTKAGSNVSRYDKMKWAKRPFPGEDVFLVGEAYSVLNGWNEGALESAYDALNEGWDITQPETY